MGQENRVGSDLISLSQMVTNLKGKRVTIPLLQRNYKWDPKEEGKKLLIDILAAKKKESTQYTIGMITLYFDNNEGKTDMIQVIDGQQRLITLSLMMKSLGKTKDFLKLHFERDEDRERETYLTEDFTEDKKKNRLDLLRMKAMEDLFKDLFGKCSDQDSGFDKNELFQWIMDHVKLICRYTKSPPLQEFLNINEKKTPFSSTDYDRAYQLKYQSIKQNITPDMIIKEHKAIEKYLYQNAEIFDLARCRYDETEYINRMDLLFASIKGEAKSLSEFYEKLDHEEQENRERKYEECYRYLKYCHKALRSIHQELKKQETTENQKKYLNVNIYNAVQTLYKIDPRFKFFDLINRSHMGQVSFEDELIKRFSLLEETYMAYENKKKNEFMQSQLEDKLIKTEERSIGREARYRDPYDQDVSEGLMKIFEERLKETVDLIEAGKNFSELVKGGKRSFREILEENEIKKIVIPRIQRDYTLGSDKNSLLGRDGVLFSFSKAYLAKCQEDSGPSLLDWTGERIAASCLKRGKFWEEITCSVYSRKAEMADALEKLRNDAVSGKGGGWNTEISKWLNIYPCDFRYNENRHRFSGYFDYWKKCLNMDEEKFKKVKTGEFFRECKNEPEEFLFSVIFGCLEEGSFYLYDGQQRIVTLVFLSAFMINQMKEDTTKEDTTREDKIRYYRNLLRKFKFEDKEDANQILKDLLEGDKLSITEKYADYVTDHTTYSICELLKCYEAYENGYGKSILSFDLDFLMEKIIFEFAVVWESSVADQMYLDLNSKNVPLTHYENYKAELVYSLHSRFRKEFDEKWKYQLDNAYLDICFQSPLWTHESAKKAEETEIKIIQWCFKMACMEFEERKIGNIKDKKNRLRWIEEERAEDILSCVGSILSFQIFSFGQKEKDNRDRITKYTEDCDSFTWDEFQLWNELRKQEDVVFQPWAFEKKLSLLRVNNLCRQDAMWLAEYVYFLAKKYGEKESEIIQYLMRKFHIYWTEQSLECELLETMFGVEEPEEADHAKGQKNYRELCDFFSEKYLDGSIPEKYQGKGMIDYIYCVKLNERLNGLHYEKVREWERAEFQRLKEEGALFSQKEKEEAASYLFDYSLFQYFRQMKKNCQKKAVEIMPEDLNVQKSVLEKIKDEDLLNSRLFRQTESIGQIDITMNLGKETIQKYVAEHIKKNGKSKLTGAFIKKARDYIYVEKNENEAWKLQRYDEKEHRFRETECIEVEWLCIKVDEMETEVRRMMDLWKNSERMELLYFWTTGRKDEVKKMIGEKLTKDRYTRFSRTLDFDKKSFQIFCEESYKNKQNVYTITREGEQ